MVILAPMAGLTDLAFRLIVKDFGCDFVVSEMISAQGLIYDNHNTKRLLVSDPKERPLAIQLFGHDPYILAQAAQIIEENCQPDMIDLNMGCPTPKIVRNGDGAALLKQPSLVGQVVSAVVAAVQIPVTVKIRLGWDEQTINCVEIAQRIEQAGARWVTLHARTRSQFYGGVARWDYIAKVKDKVKIEVVANGDITSVTAAKQVVEETGCDHLMIGRAALGRPWILSQIRQYLQTGQMPVEPEIDEIMATALEHLRLKIAIKGEAAAVREIRPHLAWYLKGLPDAKKYKLRLNQVASYQEVKSVLAEYEKTLAFR